MQEPSALRIEVRAFADSWVAELWAPGLGGPCVVARAILETEAEARRWAEVTVRALDETGASGVLADAASVVTPEAITAAQGGERVLIYDPSRKPKPPPADEVDIDMDVDISDEEIVEAQVVEHDVVPHAPPPAGSSELDFLSFDDDPRPAAAPAPVAAPPPPAAPEPAPPPKPPPRDNAFAFTDLVATAPPAAPPPKPPLVVKREVAALEVSVVPPSKDQSQRVAAAEVEPPAPPQAMNPDLLFESLVRPQSRFDTAPVLPGDDLDVGGAASGGGATMTAAQLDPETIAAMMAGSESEPEPAAEDPGDGHAGNEAVSEPEPPPAELSAEDVAAQLRAMAAQLVANRDQAPGPDKPKK